MELRLHLLGTVAITLGGQPVSPMRSRTAEALLIYLALHKESFSRQVLADFFWDDRSQERALSNLRTVLAMLRRQLPDHLQITRHTVAFNHDAPHWLDVTAFQAHGLQSPISDLQALLPLYRADFLSGFILRESRGFEEWALLVREQQRQHAAALLRTVVSHYLECADYDSALPHARRLLQLNPFDDLAQRHLIELLWRSGQRNTALQQYMTMTRLMAQELGVTPDRTTTALYERLRDAPFPPPRQVPTPLSAFIGREEELAQIAEYVNDAQARLVTILGPGGIGKTRLLLEATRHIAYERPGRFIEGVYFIPLADLAAAEFLPTTLAQQLNLSLHGSDNAFEQLLDHLRGRELLLALDNVEHLLTTQSRRWLARIAREAPGVRLLLSSRARLGVQGERLLQLQGLPAVAARRLFIERAAALHHAFVPGHAEREVIDRLCHLVDGMPLALELAAAGVRTLSCTEILEQVQRRLDWQFDHFPDRPRRHQNLQAVFEQSWALLAADEQEVARRLSVFAGPFNAEGARAVSGATSAQLAALRDQSLLATEEPGWFTFHPLVRRFLAQKLRKEPLLAEETADRHVDYVVQLRALTGKDSNMESRYHAMQKLMNRQHNQVIAAALRLARRRDFDGRKLVTLIEGLIFYYTHGSQFESWKVVFQQLLQALAQGEGDEETAAWLAAVLRSRIAEADLNLHAYERARAQFKALLPTAAELQNGALISFCHHKLSQLAGRRAEFDTAYYHLAAALPPLQMAPYGPQYHFHVYRTWTEVALLSGDLERARLTAEKAYALALEVDSQLEAEPVYLWAMGEISVAKGDLAQARKQLKRSLQLAREKGYWVDEVRAAISLATVLATEEPNGAAQLAASAYQTALEHHDQRFIALAARAQGHAAAALGDSDAACAYFEHCRTLLATIGDRAEYARTPQGS